MTPGDIVLVHFPQADLKLGKLRPALIIAISPGRYPDLLIALISSQLHQTIPDFDEVIDSADADFSTSKLKVTSIVRLARLTSIESSIIKARLGRISQTRLTVIRNRLRNWLD